MIETLLNKPYWVIDILPEQVPEDSAGRYEAKHLVISQLVDRIEVRPNYVVDIHFRITAEQFLASR